MNWQAHIKVLPSWTTKLNGFFFKTKGFLNAYRGSKLATTSFRERFSTTEFVKSPDMLISAL